MVRRSWSRVIPLSAGVLLAISLAGCSMIGRAEGSTTHPQAGSGRPEAKRVSLLQKVGGDAPIRSLTVEPDGRWDCQDCAGDGVTSAGALTPDQVQRLQRMLADPALAKETDAARQYKQACIDALTSTLLIPPDLTITQQDCPGEDRPPIGAEILLLLTQATPAEPTA